MSLGGIIIKMVVGRVEKNNIDMYINDTILFLFNKFRELLVSHLNIHLIFNCLSNEIEIYKKLKTN
jgi:archaellum biogenesis protein FlaJ (TadC family)